MTEWQVALKLGDDAEAEKTAEEMVALADEIQTVLSGHPMSLCVGALTTLMMNAFVNSESDSVRYMIYGYATLLSDFVRLKEEDYGPSVSDLRH